MSEDCLFCKMASGALDVPKVYEDDMVFAVHDINPRAPVHVLLIPKEHIADARTAGDAEGAVLGRMLAAARTVADGAGLLERGYRLAFNAGEDAGMTINHLHMHLIGGRQLGAEG